MEKKAKKSKNIKVIDDKDDLTTNNESICKYIKLESSTIRDIKYVYHMADIHIRNNSDRDTEYLEVFENLYNKINSFGDLNESLVVICGDTFHDKIWLKTNSISMIKKFFLKICALTDVIIIAGNHDCNINDKNQIDAISSTLQDMGTYNKAHVLRFSGCYRYNNILFNVTDLYSDVITKYPKLDDDENFIKIGLYHGMLENTVLQNGTKMSEGKFNKNDFKESDIVMLGDVHLHSFLNKDKTIAYSGSLIQQDFGESLFEPEHGIIRWDILTKHGEFVPIKNNYCFLNMTLENGILNNPYEGKEIPKNVRIKIKYKNTTHSERERVIKKLKETYNVIQYDLVMSVSGITLDATDPTDKNKAINSYKNMSDINNLIYTYTLKLEEDKKKEDSNYVSNLNKEELGEVIKSITKEIKYDFDKEQKNIELEYLDFNDMFLYGSDNKINFKAFKTGIIGLVGENKSGKTSIIDIILYAIWGKTDRSTSTNDIIRYGNTTAKSNIILKVNNTKYKISRSTTRSELNEDDKRVYNKVKLEKQNEYDPEFIPVSTSGTLETNSEIVNIIGNIEDFTSTCIITQDRPENFLFMTSGEKLTLINKNFKLDILNTISKIIDKKTKDLEAIVNDYKKRIGSHTHVNTENNMHMKKTTEKEINDITTDISLLEDEIDKLKEKRMEINLFIETHKNINESKTQEDCEDEIDETTEEWDDIKASIENLEEKINKNISNLEKFSKILKKEDKIKKNNIKFEENKKKKISKLENKYTKLLESKKNTNYENININSIEKKLKNIYGILDKDTSKITKLKEQHEELKKKLTSNKKVDGNLISEYENKLQQIESINKTIGINNREILKLNKLIDELKDYKYNEQCEVCMNNPLTKRLLDFNTQIESYNKNNEELNNNLLKLNTYIEKNNIKYEKNIINANEMNENEKINIEMEKINTTILMLEKDIKINTNEKETLEDSIKKYHEYHLIIEENNKIDTEAQALKEEIEELRQSTDKKYNKLISSYEKIKDEENKMEKNKNKLETLKEKDKNLSAQIKLLEQELKIIMDNQETITKLRTYNDELKKINNDITMKTNMKKELDKTLVEKYNKKRDLENTLIRINEDKKYMESNMKELELYSSLRNSTRSGDNGLYEYIMKNTIIPTLEATINSILTTMENFTIKIDYSNYKFNVMKVNGNILSSGVMASGYEKTLINICFRFALSLLNNNLKTNFFIMDEALRQTDNSNKIKLKPLFEYMRTNYKWAIIITHDDYIKDNFDSQIIITKHDGSSKIAI